MSKVVVYTGQAGTGKTTSLMSYLSEEIPKREWQKFETILALTFMHGSRKRLESKLLFIKKDFKLRAACSTIDSFALTLINRFRPYLGISKPISVNFDSTNTENLFEIQLSLESIHKYANELFAFESVRKFVANTYPFIIIDEFQDCDGTLLEFVKRLAGVTHLLIAADAFQHLVDSDTSNAMDWIQKNDFQITDLNQSGVKRTSNNRILNSSTSLRTGNRENGPQVKIFPCPSKHLSAVILKTNIFYNIAHGNMAIITPSKGSTFVRDTMESLSSEYTFKKGPHEGQKIGPYHHLVSNDDNSNDFDHMIKDIPKKALDRPFLNALKNQRHFVLKRCAQRLLKKMSLRNLTNVSYEDFIYTLKQINHTYETFYRQERTSKITYTSVYGAKNREFDTVFVIWPYQVPKGEIYQRKLLYNAITRAKKNVFIIAQSRSANLEDLSGHKLLRLII